ncbi:GntR family transcriptional regulator [Cucumibacter marinus]|uniref:hypothetical protein n=1 Tax=Cucumibacter marinus TaxID=1121252 RepID=UPI0012DE1B52|nr:hypothetical protein [Cucumibacter marinus]
MGKRDYRAKKGGKPPPFVQIRFSTLNHPAWRDLTPVARSLYLEIKLRYNGTNNGTIGLGCREAAKALGVGVNTASRAFQDLDQHGFIKRSQGGYFSSLGSKASEWRLTEHRDDKTGHAATRDFEKWRPEKQDAVPSERRSVTDMGHSGIGLPQETDLRLSGGTQTTNPASHESDTYTSSHRQGAKHGKG